MPATEIFVAQYWLGGSNGHGLGAVGSEESAGRKERSPGADEASAPVQRRGWREWPTKGMASNGREEWIGSKAVCDLWGDAALKGLLGQTGRGEGVGETV